jgi:hypothetical protein
VNQKTAKLLKKYALQTKKELREVKRWWNTLTHTQTGVQRKKLEAEIA